jgi:hypothetical protein
VPASYGGGGGSLIKVAVPRHTPFASTTIQRGWVTESLFNDALSIMEVVCVLRYVAAIYILQIIQRQIIYDGSERCTVGLGILRQCINY